MEAIYKRASVRTYADKDVPDELVERLLRAAMAAPSAGNQQPWEYFVVRDADIRQKLADASPYAKPSGRAPVVFVACCRTEGTRFPECDTHDMAASVENLLLEAADLGLGCVWMAVEPFEDRMAATLEALGNPQGLRPFAQIACGWPEGEVAAHGAERYDESRVHRL